MEAAQRELNEGTLLVAHECQWYPHPFLTTDAIFRNDDSTSYAFHYLIAHCFAQINTNGSLPDVTPSDDASDAQWWTLEEIMQHDDGTISQSVVEVIQRAEELHQKGALL